MGPFVANRYRVPLPLILLIICLALPASIYFSGCSQKKPPSEAGRTGGTLYFGVETAFHGFDGLGTSGFINPSMAPLNNLIQEPLFGMDTSGRLIPVLGLSATPSADGRAWDVQLRRDVYFHDGTPFTADAVIQHWSRLLNPANRYRGRPTIQPIKRVEKNERSCRSGCVGFLIDKCTYILLSSQR
jgi:4-phytase/acid phosphatase/peptide/nickel transport system substrate-binding protein